MITFLICLGILILGYVFYSRYAEKVFGVDEKRRTPAQTLADGVDFVPLPKPKTYLIQFLNIAGLGPIFGAIMGAMYGPVVFIWITIGAVFFGSIHDFFSGMISLRKNGCSLPDWIGDELGKPTKLFLRVLIVGLMIMVGAVFTSGPANILHSISRDFTANYPIPEIGFVWFAAIIFIYFVVATIFPIDKIIGRIYPIFGFALLFMAVAMLGAMIFSGDYKNIPELFVVDNLKNFHPNAQKMHIFPMLFVTVACGAISGFHATQSPLMSRCLNNEKEGRLVFFGAMISEGIIALIWAAVGVAFYGSVGGLNQFLAENGNNAAAVVSHISKSYLGILGSALVLIGVVVAPITSADTGFRAARLIIADAFAIDQKNIFYRFLISIPLFVGCFILLQINFDVIWRYFAWLNQIIATITLLGISVYLYKQRKFYWIALVPAVFMMAVCVTYLFYQ